MTTHKSKARAGIALVGIGAVVVGAVLPGAIASADSTGDATTAVTRAVLNQGNANGELNRSTLITQIQVDGEGEAVFTVPVPASGTPKDMDGFGGPPVNNGSADYDVSVDGAQTLRTSQTYNPSKMPVSVDVAATLNGQAMEPTDLAGESGLATLTYTFSNLTSQPTVVEYKDGAGNVVRKEEELPTPMAGSLSTDFDSSWTSIRSDQADTVAQNGQGGTTVGATVALLAPPVGETQASVSITGRIENAVVPPMDIKVAVIAPLDTGAGESGKAQAEEVGGSLQTLYGGAETLDAGLLQLADGLGAAVEGTTKLAEGVAETLAPGITDLNTGVADTLAPGITDLNTGVVNTLAPGVNTLNSGVQSKLIPGASVLVTSLQGLPASVRDTSGFTAITDGFNTLNSAVEGVRDAMGKFIPIADGKNAGNGGGQFLKPNGDIDKSKTDTARTLWSLIYGVRKIDVPSSSPTKRPSDDTGGLTNPKCSLANATSKANPCGAWQVANAVSLGLTTGVPGSGTPGAADALKDIRTGVKTAADTLDNPLIPGVAAVSAGLTQGATDLGDWSAALKASVTPAMAGILGALGCTGGISVTGGGVYLPFAPVDCGGSPALTQAAATVSQALYAPIGTPGPFAADGGTTEILDKAVEEMGVGASTLDSIKGGMQQVSEGLNTPGNLETAVPAIGAVRTGILTAAGGLDSLLLVVTSKANGNPDTDTSNGNTATGILSELRQSLALGGSGSSGTTGECEGYNTAGVPSSGLNTGASSSRVKATCAAADVLNISLLVSNELEKGVSTTLLNSISQTLVTGVDPLVAGINALGVGSQTLADGMPGLVSGTQALDAGVNGPGGLVDGTQKLDAGVNGQGGLVDGTAKLAKAMPTAQEGAIQLQTGVEQTLLPAVSDGVGSANETIAVLEALTEIAHSGASVPGGAAQGVDTSQGIYAFQFAGAGGALQGTLARFGLGIVLLLVAGGVGYALSRREQA